MGLPPLIHPARYCYLSCRFSFSVFNLELDFVTSKLLHTALAQSGASIFPRPSTLFPCSSAPSPYFSFEWRGFSGRRLFYNLLAWLLEARTKSALRPIFFLSRGSDICSFPQPLSLLLPPCSPRPLCWPRDLLGGGRENRSLKGTLWSPGRKSPTLQNPNGCRIFDVFSFARVRPQRSYSQERTFLPESSFPVFSCWTLLPSARWAPV